LLSQAVVAKACRFSPAKAAVTDITCAILQCSKWRAGNTATKLAEYLNGDPETLQDPDKNLKEDTTKMQKEGS